MGVRLTETPASFKDYKPEGGGDQVKLIHFDGRRIDRTEAVTDAGRDVWRPAVAVGPADQVVVAWAEMRDGNWDLYARTFHPSKASWDKPRRLTTDPGADTDPVLATTSNGRVMVAWQAWREGQADILLAPIEDTSRPVNISQHPANDWSPALAAGADGRLFVAFDSYRNGSYDVFLADASSTPARLIAVADSTKFEARPSLAVDAKGRAWVAFEERPDNWGKDFGKHSGKDGVPLYRDSVVRVRCVEGDKVVDAGDPVALVKPPGRRFNSFPRLTLDHTGRPWLLYRHRQENNWQNNPMPVVGALWIEYATTLAGTSWTIPQPLAHSDNLLDNRPALAAPTSGPVLAFYSSDGRIRGAGGARQGPQATAKAKAKAKGAGGPGLAVNNNLYVSALSAPDGAAAPQPGAPVAKPAAVPPAHPHEAADIARLRSYRLTVGDQTLRPLRGEFHRHTEISADGGGDGALEDMWRYGIDVGGLDWIGCGDHDNGGGKEYTWWLTQKTTDIYHNPPAFVPMFTYERSVNYPGGHRNVMFAYRGVRTLPRLTAPAGGVLLDVDGRDLDAQMLYKYLHELNGICAAHTSATDMGTDWRENDPKVEPVVEIYQGDRDSYEGPGEPRVAHGLADAAGGWQPLGLVSNALAMNYRLGFQSSSDHISTHISFAIALARDATRTAIFEAFQQRHCYAATDNILLVVRSGQHLMGDEFETDKPVTLEVQAHGTAAIQRIDIIKNGRHVYTAEPGKDSVEFRWTDEEAPEGKLCWYYVRLLQKDGEIAWGSPMWVHPAQRGR